MPDEKDSRGAYFAQNKPLAMSAIPAKADIIFRVTPVYFGIDQNSFSNFKYRYEHCNRVYAVLIKATINQNDPFFHISHSFYLLEHTRIQLTILQA